ncbi:hypothetical protein PGIN_84-3_00198 [Porphyromonas gingivalis]|nr:hypothetical protein PGIN_84-3_00198 [Porphyromonas gingivalis]
MTWKPPLLPDHYAAGESQKSVIYSYLLFLWYVRLDRTGVNREKYKLHLCHKLFVDISFSSFYLS